MAFYVVGYVLHTLKNRYVIHFIETFKTDLMEIKTYSISYEPHF